MSGREGGMRSCGFRATFGKRSSSATSTPGSNEVLDIVCLVGDFPDTLLPLRL
jgi:hypothetical protein